MYTDTQAAKLDRLHHRLKKLGYRFYGMDEGIGQPGIFTDSYKLVDGSASWLVDLVEGKLTGPQISKALLQGTTPYVVAAAAAARMRKASNSEAKTRTLDEPPSNERSEDVGRTRIKCEHCDNDATQAFYVNVTKRYPLCDDATEVNWEQGEVVENEDDPIYACDDCGPDGP